MDLSTLDPTRWLIAGQEQQGSSQVFTAWQESNVDIHTEAVASKLL